MIRERRERVKPDCEEAIRKCEAAAALVKAAGDELADCWNTLALEISSGTSATGLLRKRAWCNVLELRLKERAHALEAARLAVDAVWMDIVSAVRGRDLLNRLLRRNNNELSAAHQVWPLLVQGATARNPETNPLKKS